MTIDDVTVSIAINYRRSGQMKQSSILSVAAKTAPFPLTAAENYVKLTKLLYSAEHNYNCRTDKIMTAKATGTLLNKRSNEQNNAGARALLFFLHFFAVLC